MALNNARERSRDVRRVSDIRQIQTALELYFNANNSYPVAGTNAGQFAVGGAQFITASGGTVLMSPVPSNPSPDDCGVSWGEEYVYTQTGSGTGYTLQYCLGNVTGGIPAGVRTATNMTIQ